MSEEPARPDLSCASAHDEAADRHMNAAVLWRDIGDPQRAVIEVKYAMVERQLAQLERDRESLEHEPSEAASGAQPVTPPASTKGAVEVVHVDDCWHVLVDADREASSSHEYRLTAVVVAQEIAQRTRRELVIRGWDGKPREHLSYRDHPTKERVIYRRPELRRA